MSPEAQRKAAALYLLCQGAAVAGWWAWMIASPAEQSKFFPSGTPLAVFAAPDALVLMASTFTAGALALKSDTKWASAAGWLTAGAALYAMAGAIALNWPLGSRPLADAGMTLVGLGSLWSAVIIAKP